MRVSKIIKKGAKNYYNRKRSGQRLVKLISTLAYLCNLQCIKPNLCTIQYTKHDLDYKGSAYTNGKYCFLIPLCDWKGKINSGTRLVRLCTNVKIKAGIQSKIVQNAPKLTMIFSNAGISVIMSKSNKYTKTLFLVYTVSTKPYLNKMLLLFSLRS